MGEARGQAEGAHLLRDDALSLLHGSCIRLLTEAPLVLELENAGFVFITPTSPSLAQTVGIECFLIDFGGPRKKVLLAILLAPVFLVGVACYCDTFQICAEVRRRQRVCPLRGGVRQPGGGRPTLQEAEISLTDFLPPSTPLHCRLS